MNDAKNGTRSMEEEFGFENVSGQLIDRRIHLHSFIHLFIHLFIHKFIHLFIHKFIHLFIHKFIHLFIHKFIHLFIHEFIHLFIHKFIHSSIYPFLRQFTNSSSPSSPFSFVFHSFKLNSKKFLVSFENIVGNFFFNFMFSNFTFLLKICLSSNYQRSRIIHQVTTSGSRDTVIPVSPEIIVRRYLGESSRVS